ncbi:hypothetical protein [Allokutzneria albata]|uniref:hypothetical protein n=1 Tax=Allokutzneria albata TaxID=211114 RepID=UPI000A6C805C|nr:hypothetical protein [Allokutzneria albata]
MGKPGDQNSDYYGYDVTRLDQQSNGTEPGQHSGSTPAWSKHYTESWEHANPQDQGDQQRRETPPADGHSMDIEAAKLQIMSEQPGTAEERAQWRALAGMLQSVQTHLRSQTDQLDGDWESPFAKESFLSRIGKSLAFLEVWKRAATENSEALGGLAKVMRDGQSRMNTLYNEFVSERDAANYGFGDYAREWGENLIGLVDIGDMGEYEETTIQRVRDDWSFKARKLLSDIAADYSPHIAKLSSGRAKMLVPRDAVFHPGALGLPTPPCPEPPAALLAVPEVPAASRRPRPRRPPPPVSATSSGSSSSHRRHRRHRRPHHPRQRSRHRRRR